MAKLKVTKQIQRTLKTADYEALKVDVGLERDISYKTEEEKEKQIQEVTDLLMVELTTTIHNALDTLQISPSRGGVVKYGASKGANKKEIKEEASKKTEGKKKIEPKEEEKKTETDEKSSVEQADDFGFSSDGDDWGDLSLNGFDGVDETEDFNVGEEETEDDGVQTVDNNDFSF